MPDDDSTRVGSQSIPGLTVVDLRGRHEIETDAMPPLQARCAAIVDVCKRTHVERIREIDDLFLPSKELERAHQATRSRIAADDVDELGLIGGAQHREDQVKRVSRVAQHLASADRTTRR